MRNNAVRLSGPKLCYGWMPISCCHNWQWNKIVFVPMQQPRDRQITVSPITDKFYSLIVKQGKSQSHTYAPMQQSSSLSKAYPINLMGLCNNTIGYSKCSAWFLIVTHESVQRRMKWSQQSNYDPQVVDGAHMLKWSSITSSQGSQKWKRLCCCF